MEVGQEGVSYGGQVGGGVSGWLRRVLEGYDRWTRRTESDVEREVLAMEEEIREKMDGVMVPEGEVEE